MKLQTASETISFIRDLEEKSAKFCERVAGAYSKDVDMWTAFAKENRKYIAQVQRVYQSVITDAIEGGYAFNLESDDYTFETELRQNADYSGAVAKAVEIEEKILKLYNVGAEQSMDLMADVPRNFVIIARKRNDRIPKLKALG